MAKNEIPVTDGKNEIQVKEKAEVKPKRKQGSWLPHVAQPDTNPGDTTQFLRLNLELAGLPKIDLNNPEEIEQQFTRYFEIYAKYDTKPTVAGMAMVLGIDRRRLWEVVHDAATYGKFLKLPTESKDLIKKGYLMLEVLWENYLNSGKLNPMVGMFLGNNQFGYKNQTEHVLTPNTQPTEDYSAADIRQRYITDSDD